jgi:hypothetical protein
MNELRHFEFKNGDKMIEVKAAKQNDNFTKNIGAWIFNENDACIFLPTFDIINTIEFINKIDTYSPGYAEAYRCTNCALTYTNQFMISDCSEDIVLELTELTKFVEDLRVCL